MKNFNLSVKFVFDQVKAQNDKKNAQKTRFILIKI
jgi:hypothetical protein